MIEQSYGRYISDQGMVPVVEALKRRTPPMEGAGLSSVFDEAPSRNLAGIFAFSRRATRKKSRLLRRLQSGPRGNRTPVCDVRGRRPNR
jgi:hypothetical protein